MPPARDTDPPDLPRAVEDTAGRADELAGELARLEAEMERMERAASHGLPEEAPAPRRARGSARGFRQQRGELEPFRRETSRWRAELARLRGICESLREPESEGELERKLAEKDAELRVLREVAAGRELDLQRVHAEESRRQLEEIATLERRLEERDSGSSRNEELREAKRLAYERERELRRAHAEKLSEVEEEAGRRISALQAQRAADNRSLAERHADQKARQEEELESLRLRRLSEFRVYGSRIEELVRERAEERTSLEEAVARLREKHEAERARLQERVDGLEEALEEQETITVGLLGELGYVYGPERTREQSEPGTELEVSVKVSETGIREALRELRGQAAPANLLREGLALFNDTEHPKVVEAISKSLGEPEVYAVLEAVTGDAGTPVITLVWPGMGWRRYVSEPRSESEPKVYLTGYGAEADREALPRSGPNARLDGRGLLSLGVRPL